MRIAILSYKELENFRTQLADDLNQIIEMKDNRRWIKTAEVQKLLKCSANTVRNYRRNGTLPYTKLGGALYYDREGVLKLLEVNFKLEENDNEKNDKCREPNITSQPSDSH